MKVGPEGTEKVKGEVGGAGEGTEKVKGEVGGAGVSVG